ncbi:NADH-quinone oxidoreductase subunit L [Hazenella coriacea]|uniref:NADH-quinone oxidoreductase subunit L n=1 Tax=Hazenella coriacea TaxID=1179467 RepID=A0A4R3LDR9_9BACL|nr:NADH-quinone oxidoreductase subunit L [Hazenella coriacea]TCS95606.1 NADH-quinone oxidoreductase subunit L [Hazenella coriacea]
MIALYIPLFPLLAFLLLIVGRKVWKKSIAASIGMGATGIAFFCSLPVLWESIQQIKPITWKMHWFQMGLYDIQLSFELGALQVLMLVIVSGVSFLVQIYSWGYMKEDERLPAFYAYLSLFTFSMLGLVISANLLQIYIFWELVGVCSFLLVGFWYFKPEAKAAAKKAFIVTRIGDLGLFIAIGLLFAHVGSFELSDLKMAVSMGELEAGLITLTAILIFIGAMGKSGQFPLHTWLPDAMEGPTPVSALIHAATMVAAGVYLVANLFFLFQASETAMTVVAYVGGFTAIFAATIGVAQNDIKRVLAYSTVSQLGYMMLALGSAGYVAGVFHLMTHSFFKALLFLGAGAVIMSLHHVQDLRKMGGLWKTHRWLGIWFLVGCLSIAGIPPFSGFFSKDEILLSTYADGRIGLFIVGLTAAFFTAFYMFRLFFMVFTGESRSEQQPTKASGWMMVPIVILGLFSIGAGFVQTPTPWLSDWLTQSSGVTSISLTSAPSWIPVVAVVVALLGISLAYYMYVKKPSAPATLAGKLPWAYQLVHRKYYIDECYEVMFVYSLKGLGWFLYGWDRFIVGGLVHLSASLVSWIGQLGSRLQNGQVQTYALISLIGFVLLLVGLTAGRLFE